MIKSLLKVFGGNVFVQALGLLTVPLLTKVYSPGEMSYLGTFTSCIAIISVFISLRAENNLFIIREEKDCREFVFFLYLLAIIVTPIIFSLIFIFFIFNPLGTDQKVFLLSVFGGFTYSCFNIKYNHLVRIGAENNYIILRVIRMVIESLAVVVAWMLDFNIYWFITIIAFSYLLPAFIKNKKNRVTAQGNESFVEVLKNGKSIFLQILVNIKYDFPASIFSMVTIYLPIIYFFLMDEKIFSGVYFAINRFIGAPSLLVAQSFGVTLKQYAAEEYLKLGTCINSTKRAIKILFIYMIPLYIFGVFVFYVMYEYFLSNEWKSVFLTGGVLIPLFFTRYFFNCFANIVYIKGLFRENLIFQLLSTTLAFASLYLPTSLPDKIYIFSIVMPLYYIFYLIYLLIKAFQRNQEEIC
ncbi:hypothetical protein KQ929_06975 [Leclercia pneumoniae]|uniref:Putative O-antigen transporter n=1 Tax=Leclercia pneumoniae TaxID=2815358 RepID=A0ABX8JXH3_9ENTR|nr:hypothetical protein [Leclercia pneumoniae]QSW34107.1 hypothetical protein JZ655_13530 [Leclercia pneumoniae]QWW80967.1 hypothetical protein KQ929_06975 [Leclercia pneumoniae]